MNICCKFGNFREGLFSRNFAYAKFRENKTFAKINPHEMAKPLSFTDVGKSCPTREFLTSQICILMLFAKIEFSRKFRIFIRPTPGLLVRFAQLKDKVKKKVHLMKVSFR